MTDASRRATEHYGLGQSGYTAGRREPDLALELQLQPRNAGYPRPMPDDPLRDELDTDDRFVGRGGAVPKPG